MLGWGKPKGGKSFKNKAGNPTEFKMRTFRDKLA